MMEVWNKGSNSKGQPQVRPMWSSQDIFHKPQQLWSSGFESLPPLMFKGNILSKVKLAD